MAGYADGYIRMFERRRVDDVDEDETERNNDVDNGGGNGGGSGGDGGNGGGGGRAVQLDPIKLRLKAPWN